MAARSGSLKWHSAFQASSLHQWTDAAGRGRIDGRQLHQPRVGEYLFVHPGFVLAVLAVGDAEPIVASTPVL